MTARMTWTASTAAFRAYPPGTKGVALMWPVEGSAYSVPLNAAGVARGREADFLTWFDRARHRPLSARRVRQDRRAERRRLLGLLRQQSPASRGQS